MEDKNKHIDDLYREELHNYREAPREMVWSKIEANLDRLADKKEERSYRFIWFTVGALLLSVTAYIGYYHNSKKANWVNIVSNRLNSKNSDINTKGTNNNVPANIENSTKTFIGKNVRTEDEIGKKDRILANDTVATIKIKKVTETKNSDNVAANEIINNNAEHNITPDKVKTMEQASDAGQSVPASPAPVLLTTVVKKKNHIKAVYETASENTKPENLALTVNASTVSDKKNITTTNAASKTVATSNKSKVTSFATGANTNEEYPSLPKKDVVNKQIIDKKPLEKVSSTKSAMVKDNANTLLTSGKPVSNEKNTEDAMAENKKPATPKSKHAPLNNSFAKSKHHEADNIATMASAKVRVVATNDIAMTTNFTKKEVGMPLSLEPLPGNKYNATEPKDKSSASPTGNNKKSSDIKSVDHIVASQNNIAKEIPKIDAGKNEVNNATGGSISDPAPKNKMHFSMNGGIKAGYEKGFGKYNASKIIGSAYVEISPSKNISIVIQPGIKQTTLNNPIYYGSKTYVNNVQKIIDSTPLSTGAVFFYHYHEIFDSLTVKTQNLKSRYVGFEMPILFKYKVANNLALLGGMNVDISQIFSIGEVVTTQHITGVQYAPPLAPAAPNEVDSFLNSVQFTHSSLSYTPAVLVNNATQVRLGYMLGVDYSFKNKMFVELMMTQVLSNQNNISDANVRSVYTQPYFRVSVGYNLFNKSSKK
ncbi:MAG: hypothetical protein H0X33_14670 [Taibaiella sp.]|nr:hypothetical protein [Taibaiella sp.]